MSAIIYTPPADRRPRTVFTPESETAWLALRRQNVTSTQSAMLFGLSPYGTAFELWHQKQGHDDDFEPNERMDWGTDLQDSIAGSLARRYGVIAVPMKEYISLDDARMGSSFDYRVVGQIGGGVDGSIGHMFETLGPGLLEIKNVDSLVFRDKWMTDQKVIEPPGHIEIQVQHQLHVTGIEWAAIGVLVGGNKGHLLIRPRDRDVGMAIEQRIRAFWKSIDDDVMPDPVYPDDAKFVASLYGYARTGAVADLRSDAEASELAAQYKAASDREKLAKEDKDIAKAKLLTKIGDAERAVLDGFTISAGMTAACHVSYDRDAYRNWRVTPKKG